MTAHYRFGLWFCLFENQNLGRVDGDALSVKECQMVNALMSEMVFEGVGSAVRAVLKIVQHRGYCVQLLIFSKSLARPTTSESCPATPDDRYGGPTSQQFSWLSNYLVQLLVRSACWKWHFNQTASECRGSSFGNWPQTTTPRAPGDRG